MRPQGGAAPMTSVSNRQLLRETLLHPRRRVLPAVYVRRRAVLLPDSTALLRLLHDGAGRSHHFDCGGRYLCRFPGHLLQGNHQLSRAAQLRNRSGSSGCRAPDAAKRIVLDVDGCVLLYHFAAHPIRSRSRLAGPYQVIATYSPRTTGTMDGCALTPDLLITGREGAEQELVAGEGFRSVLFLVPPADLERYVQVDGAGPHFLSSNVVLVQRLYEWSRSVRCVEVPQYFTNIPADPFSGRPLLFRPAPAAYTIYSIGPNGADDGGDLTSELPRGAGGGWGQRVSPRRRPVSSASRQLLISETHDWRGPGVPEPAKTQGSAQARCERRQSRLPDRCRPGFAKSVRTKPRL